MEQFNGKKFCFGLRFIAGFEAAKGVIVILAGFGLLSLVHKDVLSMAEHLVGRFHLDRSRHTANLFLELAADLDDSRLRLLALLAVLYSAMRFAEAYGLWFQRRWGEWVAVISGALYIPLEIEELHRGFSLIKASAFIVNVIVVIYVASFLFGHRKAVGTLPLNRTTDSQDGD